MVKKKIKVFKTKKKSVRLIRRKKSANLSSKKLPIKIRTRKVLTSKKIKKFLSKKIAKKPSNKNLKKKIFKVAVIKKLKKVRAIHKNNNSREKFSAQSFFKAKIKVIGIGGGGGSIVSEISRSLHKATFTIADTDVRAFKKKTGIKYFLFGQELTHGLGTGLNTELAKSAAENEKEKIAKLFENQDIVIFVACLGGGLGSGATQIFSEVAKNFNGITVGIITLPFKFEGKNKYKIAYKSLNNLRKLLNVSITIPNERIFKIIKSDTSITNAFSIVNKSLIESLESLIDLIYNPGIINIDFADLRTILKGDGNTAFLNTVWAQGKDRAEKVSNEILNNILCQNNNFTAENILFNILGSDNLGMFEVDTISRAISQKNPKAKIIFGISKNPSLKNKIKATLLMTGPSNLTKINLPKVSVVNGPKTIDNIIKSPILKLSKVKEADSKKTKPVLVLKKNKKINKNSNRKESNITKKDKLSVFPNTFSPSFDNYPIEAGSFKKLNVIDSSGPETSSVSAESRQILSSTEKSFQSDVVRDNKNINQVNYLKSSKAIRRTALEIKEAEEIEENKKSQQEKEWEIPAFLRLKK